jgi:hypothetical protein
MTPEAVLIQKPAIDFATLLTLSQQALGRSVATAADASGRQLSDVERFLSYLAAIGDENAPAGFANLGHCQVSMFVAVGDGDVIDVLSASQGMPFVGGESVRPGVSVLILSGTLGQWRDAVKAGLEWPGGVRICFAKILAQFERNGIYLWREFTKRPTADGFFKLEDKR